MNTENQTPLHPFRITITATACDADAAICIIKDLAESGSDYIAGGQALPLSWSRQRLHAAGEATAGEAVKPAPALPKINTSNRATHRHRVAHLAAARAACNVAAHIAALVKRDAARADALGDNYHDAAVAAAHLAALAAEFAHGAAEHVANVMADGVLSGDAAEAAAVALAAARVAEYFAANCRFDADYHAAAKARFVAEYCAIIASIHIQPHVPMPRGGPTMTSPCIQ